MQIFFSPSHLLLIVSAPFSEFTAAFLLTLEAKNVLGRWAGGRIRGRECTGALNVNILRGLEVPAFQQDLGDLESAVGQEGRDKARLFSGRNVFRYLRDILDTFSFKLKR